MIRGKWRDAYPRLHSQVALKRLEVPYLYHIAHDELYELNDEGWEFLLRCDGSTRGAELAGEDDFVEFCLDEGLVELLPGRAPMVNRVGKGPVPSLRYLELQLTRRCNLACRHCYLGPPISQEIELDEAVSIARRFEDMGGLRLIISGGEPLLYPRLREFLEQTSELKLRRVILTNGTLVNAGNAGWLKAEEIQFSLDGWKRGHDMMRGEGSFDRVMAGIEAVMKQEIPVSIATMVHRGNLDEFQTLRSFTEEIGAVQWGIDILCPAGSLEKNRDLIVPYDVAVPLMEHAFGGGYHGSSDGFACGHHLMTVTSTGRAIKCGFYEERPLGDARRDLLSCWLNLEHIPVEMLECKGCPAVDECAGGCRFRAEHPLAADRAMCAFYGVDPPNNEKGGGI